MIHKLKIKSEYADKFSLGDKDWELRKNDRDFKKGDLLHFLVIDSPINYYTEVTYVFEGGKYGLEKGYVIMSIKKLAYSEFEQLSNTF